MRMTFIVPVTEESTLASNVLCSQIYKDGRHEFIFQRGFCSVAKAYNDAIAKASSDILIFMHQDVFLPPAWEEDITAALKKMDSIDSAWGVLGVAGAKPASRTSDHRLDPVLLGCIKDRGKEWGASINLPQQTQTLDEQLFIVKKEDAHFDANLPGNHFYGVDLCMRLAREGKKSYVISAYLHHNSANYWLKQDYYECQQYIHDKYYESLPIETTSGPVLKDQLPIYFERALARRDLINLIPAGAQKVLEVGAGMGKTGQVLKEMGYSDIVGIELSSLAATRARQYYNNFLVGDVEKLEIKYGDGYFDAIMYGDVLEHLTDPWAVLSKHRRLLAREGCVVASVPNIRHYHLLRRLLFRGRWDYTDMGLLDRTHLRFFTKKTIYDMFDGAGYRILKIVPAYKAPRRLRKINKYLRGCLTDFLALQYNILAVKK